MPQPPDIPRFSAPAQSWPGSDFTGAPTQSPWTQEKLDASRQKIIELILQQVVLALTNALTPGKAFDQIRNWSGLLSGRVDSAADDAGDAKSGMTGIIDAIKAVANGSPSGAGNADVADALQRFPIPNILDLPNMLNRITSDLAGARSSIRQLQAAQSAQTFYDAETFTFDIAGSTSWAVPVTMGTGDKVQLVGLGGGQSGAPFSQGGNSGTWATTTLVVGIDVSPGDVLSVTVGAGGAVKFGQTDPGQATTVTRGSTVLLVASGGSGSPSGAAGASPGDVDYDGISYYGGAAQSNLWGRPGNAPGGGGSGGVLGQPGGPGAAGALAIRVVQATVPDVDSGTGGITFPIIERNQPRINAPIPAGATAVRIHALVGQGGTGGTGLVQYGVNRGGGGGGGGAAKVGYVEIPVSALGSTYSVSVTPTVLAGPSGSGTSTIPGMDGFDGAATVFSSGGITLTAGGGKGGKAGTTVGGAPGAGGVATQSGLPGAVLLNGTPGSAGVVTGTAAAAPNNPNGAGAGGGGGGGANSFGTTGNGGAGGDSATVAGATAVVGDDGHSAIDGASGEGGAGGAGGCCSGTSGNATNFSGGDGGRDGGGGGGAGGAPLLRASAPAYHGGSGKPGSSRLEWISSGGAPLPVVDNGDGSATLTGDFVVTNGDGTATLSGAGVVDNGDGTATITA